MALSNIFNEPRREITETIVGVMVVGLLLMVSLLSGYLLAAAAASRFPEDSFAFDMVMGSIGTAILMTAAFFLVRFVHFIGEEVCDALDDRGVHMRPQERNRA